MLTLQRPQTIRPDNARVRFINTITDGLLSKSYTRCDRWAERYRVMGRPLSGPWTFLYHPWTREMHMHTQGDFVGQKAAQMGYTETMLNIALFAIDQQKRDVLYVLPAKTPDATDFSNARFDPALELSPHLAGMFTNVNNVALKRAGSNSLYIRGSRARSALKSVPAGVVILDEVDEFTEGAVALARERLSGQIDKLFWQISTPSVPNHGINVHYEQSDRRHFFFKCPSCSKFITLTFPESIVICGDSENDPATAKSHLQCPSCQTPLRHEEKPQILATGQWVPENPSSAIRGYHISQLFSCVLQPGEIAKAYHAAQTSVVKEQEFYNSKLGLPHIPKGSTISEEVLTSVTSNFKMREPRLIGTGFNTIGIDVGTKLHIEVTNWRLNSQTAQKTIDINDVAVGRVLYVCSLTEFAELDTLMYTFKPLMTVIDHLPETRSALAFARRFPGRVRLCHYGNAVAGRDIVEHTEMVTVDRTSWLDLAFSRFINKTILLPVDIPLEYKAHMKNLVRIPKQKDDGPLTFIYKKTGADHYAHARAYSEIALSLAVTTNMNLNITEQIHG